MNSEKGELSSTFFLLLGITNKTRKINTKHFQFYSVYYLLDNSGNKNILHLLYFIQNKLLSLIIHSHKSI